MKVLIADDDAQIRELLRRLLSQAGAEVDCVSGGDQAIELLRNHQYDAILLDLMMPGRNGFDVLQDIRALHHDLLKRVIIITAASQETIRWLDTSAVFRLLRKPFDIGELLVTVRDCAKA